MRSGKLVHVIKLYSYTTQVNAAGTPVEDWHPLATLRAEIVSRATEDFLQNAGEASIARAVFRTRYVANACTGYRIEFGATWYEIEEVTILGRNKGLELRCRQVIEQVRA